ncbi:hypothetical protein HL273_08835 [Yersinia enterocolitica]|nr:hypothetical protein [Yersinia enterocolitica]MBX9485816.1 hypothetical protein [Yersinia enterocolitica]NQS96723.1 hypothetical protein [Yersinia enterocolitica]NQT43400.1 hypothetical protein [Yersinia enterocolitica]NQT98800.1 hypothetical protein [Yersinia enterocolitica]HDM8448666.1 hypothetical protein [Yersinia enterocolitica]
MQNVKLIDWLVELNSMYERGLQFCFGTIRDHNLFIQPGDAVLTVRPD